MDEIKKRINFYSDCDCTGIETYLRKMAAKGLILNGIGLRTWKFRKEEPRSMSFSVVYYPKRVDMGEMTAERQRFIEEHSVEGWKFLVNNGKMHVFCNENGDAAPIVRGAEERVKSIHRFAWGNLIALDLLFLVISAVVTAYVAVKLPEKPIEIMTDAAYKTWVFMIFGPFSAYNILAYLSWYLKAKKAAEDGVFVPTKRFLCHERFFVFLYFMSATLKLCTFFSPSQLTFGAVALIFGAVLIFVFRLLKRSVIRKDTPDEKLKNIIRAVAVVMIAVFVAGSAGVYTLFPARTEKIQNDRGRTVTVYRDKNLPLDLEELVSVDGEVSKHKSREWLGFVDITETEQYAVNDEEISLFLNVYRVNHMAFYDACVKEVMWLFSDMCVETDPVPWGADKVYCYGEKEKRFFVCKDNVIAEIDFSWNPTQEQIKITSEKIF